MPRAGPLFVWKSSKPRGSFRRMRLPHPNAPGLKVGIDEALINGLVHTFYARIRLDPVLGPVFNEAVSDWDEHLEHLCAFWSSVMLLTGRFKGAPFQVHAALPNITEQHFERWLELFAATAAELCPNDAADLFVERAFRISKSLKTGIVLHRSGLTV